MKSKLITLLLILTAAIFASCGATKEIVGVGLTTNGLEPNGETPEIEKEEDNSDDQDGDNNHNIIEIKGMVFDLEEIMFDVHEWIPQIPVNVNIGDNTVAYLFKPECHMYGKVNVCPEGAEIGFDNKFTLGSVIGLIEHAGMYASEIFRKEDLSKEYNTCGIGRDAAELSDHTAVFIPSESDRFVVRFYDLFDCVSNSTYQGTTLYSVYSKSEEGDVYASLTSRKRHPGTEWYTGIMSDIYQSYQRTDIDGNMLTMAYNGVSFDEKTTGNWGSRSVLVVSAQSKRLALKIGNIGSTGIVLVGGAGYYKVKIGSSNNERYICIRGVADDATVVDVSECGNLEGLNRFFENDNWPAWELYRWLGLDRKDQDNISGFDSFFSNANFLSADMVPQNGFDYFPNSISR